MANKEEGRQMKKADNRKQRRGKMEAISAQWQHFEGSSRKERKRAEKGGKWRKRADKSGKEWKWQTKNSPGR